MSEMAVAAEPRVIVTPEHVEIRLLPAGLGSRFLATTADFIIVAALSAAIQFSSRAFLPQGVGFAVYSTLVFLLSWGYHVYFESRHQGRSPGKRFTGIRVVDSRGLPITPQQSLVRNLLRIIDLIPLFYGVGAMVAMIDRYNRRFGDIVADTLVIKETIPMPYKGQLASAPRYNSLKTARVMRLIRHRVSLEEREFLLSLCLRADRMEQQARYDLMEEVANSYRERLGIDDPHLSGEKLVRGLTAMIFEKR